MVVEYEISGDVFRAVYFLGTPAKRICTCEFSIFTGSIKVLGSVDFMREPGYPATLFRLGRKFLSLCRSMFGQDEINRLNTGNHQIENG